jgi:hypothetical protein
MNLLSAGSSGAPPNQGWKKENGRSEGTRLTEISDATVSTELWPMRVDQRHALLP